MTLNTAINTANTALKAKFDKGELTYENKAKDLLKDILGESLSRQLPFYSDRGTIFTIQRRWDRGSVFSYVSFEISVGAEKFGDMELDKVLEYIVERKNGKAKAIQDTADSEIKEFEDLLEKHSISLHDFFEIESKFRYMGSNARRQIEAKK